MGVTTRGRLAAARWAPRREQPTLLIQKMAASVESRAQIEVLTTDLLKSQTVQAYMAGARTVIDALLASEAKGMDMIHVLEGLAGFTDVTYRPDSSDAAAVSATQIYLTTLSAGAMAYSASLNQPSSYDDAMNVLNRVTRALDAVSLSAADAGYDSVFSELTVLKSAVTQTLQSRGATLASVAIVTYNQPLPALTLSNRLYQDAARTEGLVKMADPIHPAFMPTTFKALTS